MEEHPIPQNVTAFQFRLIGTMTVKQFAYVAAGAVLAVLTYYMPFFFAIKVVLIPFFVLFGLGMAFVPIEGRPMDAMAMYYFRALFAPNQFIYHKRGGRIAIATLSSHKGVNLPFGQQTKATSGEEKERNLQTLLTSVREGKIGTDSSLKKKRPIIISLEEEGPKQKTKPQEEFLEKPTSDESDSFDQRKKGEILDKEIETLKSQLRLTQTQLVPEQNTSQTYAARKNAQEIEKQLQEVQKQKKQLEEDIIHLEKKLVSHKLPAEPMPKSTVRRIPFAIAQSVGMPKVPSAPNLIAGIVKDARGNVLPNILIEVKNEQGSPVRAFKSNGLGQFVSATPLLNGTYQIELEDPRGQHKFDLIEIVANGKILEPIEIISVDQREELRQSLFES